jgi:transcriptional regulator GlxA family with amidase domain
MLARVRDKIETIARAVGYRSAFTFSTTFRRFTGRRPSEYRSN